MQTMFEEIIDSKKVGLYKDRLKRIEVTMQKYIDKELYAGLSTMVCRKGSLVQKSYIGYADIASDHAALLSFSVLIVAPLGDHEKVSISLRNGGAAHRESINFVKKSCGGQLGGQLGIKDSRPGATQRPQKV